MVLPKLQVSLLTEMDGVELIDGVTLTEIDGVTLIVGVTLGVAEIEIDGVDRELLVYY
jgi:hypothetical protein